MTIEQIKKNFINNKLEKGLYTSDNKIVEVSNCGFSIRTPQNNNWDRINIYEYIGNVWTESEIYER